MEASESVTTLSFHEFGPGIYPGTGGASLSPTTLNVPLRQGLTDQSFRDLYEPLRALFQPDITVLCAGLDGLVGDPLGNWQLTSQTFVDIAKSFSKGLVLGGGTHLSLSLCNLFSSWFPYLSSFPLFATLRLLCLG